MRFCYAFTKICVSAPGEAPNLSSGLFWLQIFKFSILRVWDNLKSFLSSIMFLTYQDDHHQPSCPCPSRIQLQNGGWASCWPFLMKIEIQLLYHQSYSCLIKMITHQHVHQGSNLRMVDRGSWQGSWSPIEIETWHLYHVPGSSRWWSNDLDNQESNTGMEDRKVLRTGAAWQGSKWRIMGFLTGFLEVCSWWGSCWPILMKFEIQLLYHIHVSSKWSSPTSMSTKDPT